MDNIKSKVEILYHAYLSDPEVKEINALVTILADEGFVKRSRQV